MKRQGEGKAASLAFSISAFIVLLAFIVMLVVVSVLPNKSAMGIAELTRKPVLIDEQSFPDANLLAFVEANYELDHDGYLSVPEADAVTSIGSYDTTTFDVTDKGLSSSSITDLTGLENFPNLQMLEVSDNDISKLDLQSMPSLRYVDIRNNVHFTVSYSNANEGIQLVVNNSSVGSGDLPGLDVRDV